MGFLASLWGLRFAIMSKIRFQTSVYQYFCNYVIHNYIKKDLRVLFGCFDVFLLGCFDVFILFGCLDV